MQTIPEGIANLSAKARVLAGRSRAVARTSRDRLRRSLGAAGAGLAQRSDSTPSDRASQSADVWFQDHVTAADEVLAWLASVGVDLAGRRVADVGCGDGIIDLALATKAAPAELIGFDVVPTNPSTLLERARANDFAHELPGNLRFEGSSPDRIPAEDGSFDAVVSWSCFEHVSDPDTMSIEIHRILRPGGVLFLQLWPFYYSEHGSHLMEWYPEGFAHLTTDADTVRERLDGDERVEWASYMWSEYLTLNRITVDDLGASLRGAGFRIARLELLSNTVNLPLGVETVPLSHLGITGVKLIAVP